MDKVITRFAPSPTGSLHVGNARAAILNYLYSKKAGGKFILRFDDTDKERSTEEFKKSIEKDVYWLGLIPDETFRQSERLGRYEEIKNILLEKGRLYPCFETPEELEVKRKFALSSGKPPIYDRASLKLSPSKIEEYIKKGRKPHYRFLIEDKEIFWKDLIKGDVRYEGRNLGDPVVIRENCSMTYILCSVIDDIDYDITHIIRGEDHVTNTAVQIQMFESLGGAAPVFGHFSLIKSKGDKISKRVGGFEISSLREEFGLEPMAVNSFFSFIGTSKPLSPIKDMGRLAEGFDISAFSKSPTTYDREELEELNHKIILETEFSEISLKLKEMGMESVDENFWLIVRPNLRKLSDVGIWIRILSEIPKKEGLDKEFLKIAADLLPENFTENSLKEWFKALSEKTGKKGKELFIPLRKALTGTEDGPELSGVLTLLGAGGAKSRLLG